MASLAFGVADSCMSYLDDHLLPNERVVHRARIHWIIFGWPIVLGLLGAALAVFLYLAFAPELYWLAGVGLAGLGVVAAFPPLLRYLSSDFAVTDKRVLAKYGLIRRQSLETLLGKVEAIGVDQDVAGRLLGYGTVTITGTGGTRETLPLIAGPLEFRRQVQARIVALDDAQGRRSGRAAHAEPRVERDCPHCAERILEKAKVCKHCGRDVA